MKVTQAFVDDFNLVHASFQTSPAEIQEAKTIAREKLVAAEDGYHTSAAMIRAGWKPLEEQAVAFIGRTGFTYDGHKAA